MQFSKLVQKRQNDLLDRKQRESVMASEQMLKKTLPMLSSALQTYAKYPQSAEAVVSSCIFLEKEALCFSDSECFAYI